MKAKALEIESHPLRGIFICLVAYLFVSFIPIFRKYLSADISLFVILFFQAFVCFLLILPEVFGRGLKPVQPTYYRTYLIRIASGLACYFTFFYIVNFLPVSQALLYQYSASLWIPFIAFFWQRIRLTKDMWYGILVGFLGIALILKPHGSFYGAIPCLGIVCGILQAISVVAIRKLMLKGQTALNILFYYFLAGVLFSSVFIFKSWHTISRLDFIFLCCIGLCTYLAQKLITLSLQYASATTLAPICYTSLLFSGVLSFILWNELPDKVSLLGMLLVISGCLITLVTSRVRERARSVLAIGE